MAQALAEQGWRIDAAAIRQGLARARWPGRLERHQWHGLSLLLDGAHNPPAAQSLRQELTARDGLAPRRWLLGIQRHKEAAAMLRALLLPGDQALITPIPGHACWDLQELAAACPEHAHQLQPVADPAAGLERLVLLQEASTGTKTSSGLPPPLPVAAGSLYLLGDLLSRFAADPG